MTKTEAQTRSELIDQQPELRWHMRSYLVDFLVEIHLQHRLRPETLYLALNINFAGAPRLMLGAFGVAP